MRDALLDAVRDADFRENLATAAAEAAAARNLDAQHAEARRIEATRMVKRKSKPDTLADALSKALAEPDPLEGA